MGTFLVWAHLKFAVGEVHYWSETHNCWIWTRVEEPSYDQASGVELAIKQNANRGKIRAVPQHIDGRRVHYHALMCFG